MILLAAGLLLIFLEIFLPGAILGILGGISLLLSIIFFALHFPLVWTVIYAFCLIVGMICLIRFTFNRMKKGKFRGFFLNTAQNGYVASSFEQELIGRSGEALSDLKPAGHIVVDGKKYQAVAQTGYIVKGRPIEVIGGEGAHVIVKEKNR